MDRNKVNKLVPFVGALRAYHRHEVVGIEHIPKTGPCLIAVNHSLATYDIMLLCHDIYLNHDRLARALMDRWFFKIEIVSEFMKALGAVQGERTTAKTLLEHGEIVCVAPGGMRESIRSSEERYQIMWENRKGFARIAIETGAPIILAACPKADDIFEVYPTQGLANWIYKNFKLPFAVLRGLGPTPVPRPVKLVHVLSEPIYPPKMSDNPTAFKRQVDTFHKKLIKQMEQLIGEAINYRNLGTHDET